MLKKVVYLLEWIYQAIEGLVKKIDSLKVKDITVDEDGGDLIIEKTDGSIIDYSGSGEHSSYSSLVKIAPLFHSITYDVLDYDYAKEYFQSDYTESIGACSAIRVGNFFGRNLDWYAPLQDIDASQPDFYISTPKTDKYKAVKGITSMAGVTEQMAKTHAPSSLWKVLPFFLQDGYNGSLFACLNVVPTDKGINTKTVPTVSKEDSICSRMVVRYILDRFDDALEACTYLQEHVEIYMSKPLQDMHYELHYLIGDSNHTYVLEFVNNSIKFQEHNMMTNFHIDEVEFLDNGKVYTNADVSTGNLPSSLGITPYGAGLERYNILVEGTSDIRDLMNKLFYSRAYDLEESPYWYSEFTTQDSNVTVDTPIDNPTLQAIIEEAQEIKRGEREGRLWITTHSIIYNLTDGSMEVVSFEDLSNPISLNSSKGKAEGAVLYTEQSLTPEQQLQARINIASINLDDTEDYIESNIATKQDIETLFQ